MNWVEMSDEMPADCFREYVFENEEFYSDKIKAHVPSGIHCGVISGGCFMSISPSTGEKEEYPFENIVKWCVIDRGLLNGC